MKNCILACDERGTTSLSSNSRTYTLGGFAADRGIRKQLVETWNQIKVALCGSKDVELKWNHFFPGHHQEKRNNPLQSSDPDEWRDQALWALNELFEQAQIFPITTVIQKGNIKSDFFLDKNQRLDVYQIFAATIGQFSLYLRERNCALGEIWFDQLGSKKEEDRWQNNFTDFRNSLQKSPLPEENRKLVMRIDPKIKFIDSSSEPFIQVADFVSGAIWATSEGDHWFFLQLLEKYAPGKRRTYGILLLEG